MHVSCLGNNKVTLNVMICASNSHVLMVAEAWQPPRIVMTTKIFVKTVARRRNESAQTSIFGFMTETPQNMLASNISFFPKASVEETYFVTVRIKVSSNLEALVVKHVKVHTLQIDVGVLYNT